MSDEKLNYVYTERNLLVCALSKLMPSWLEKHPETDTSWDDEWRNIVYISSPTGQLSWHIRDEELINFKHLEFKYGNSWDGHTNEEKYIRLNNLKTQPTPGEQ